MKKTTPHIKIKKAIKYSKNSEKEDDKESLKMSKTVEGLTFTVEFNQYVLIKSKIAKESSGE
jgi:hypothetical protein